MTSDLLLARLLQDPAVAAAVPPEEIPALLGELERLKATLWARMMNTEGTNMTSGQPPAPGEEDRLLTAKEAAPILGVKGTWLYRHAKRLPFARRLSRKCLRFSEAGLRRWQASKRA